MLDVFLQNRSSSGAFLYFQIFVRQFFELPIYAPFSSRFGSFLRDLVGDELGVAPLLFQDRRTKDNLSHSPYTYCTAGDR